MTQLLRSLALAGAMLFATHAAAQVFPSGAVQGNGTASTAAPRATDINSVLYQKAGSDSCVFRRNGSSVSCGSIDLSQSNAVGSSILGAANGGTGLSALATGIATWLGTPSSANLRAALTDETGTGLAYFQGGDIGTPSAGALTNATGLPVSTGISGLGTGVATALAVNVGSAGAPVVFNGALGTPSSGTLTNATGLPVSTGISGLGANVATWLATASSANLRSALTDETGTGLAYFQGGALGTPSSGTLTNATGLPVSTGVSGLGTGVATALAVNVGSAGAPVVFNGALGTPSSGTLTNATGLPVSTGVSGLGTGVATALAVNTGTDGAFVVKGGALGTPSSGTLTNATGLPVSTGISGLGTGVATALAVNVGSAGAPVVFNGALGTPSSGTLTNATGLPTAGLLANAVTNGKLAQMPQASVKGRSPGAGTGDPVDLTATQLTAIVIACQGDAGSGGVSGAVPTPGAGDAAAGKYLKADCSWDVPAGGGGGGSGMNDTERQNFDLTLIYQSKSFAEYRRVVKKFATGLKGGSDSVNGIATGSSSNYTVTSASGYVGPTCSNPIGTTGTYGQSNTGNNALNSSLQNLGFQFTAGATGTIANVSIETFNSPSGGSWKARIYTNSSGSPGSQVGTDSGNVTISTAAKQTFTFATPVSVTNGTVYWIVIMPSTGSPSMDVGRAANQGGYGSGRNNTIASIVDDSIGGSGEWRVGIVGGTVCQNATIVTTAQTTGSSVSNARVLIEYDPVDAATLNTDITVEVTCDGGSNWASATLSSVTDYSGTSTQRKVAETADTSCTSGTSFQARLKNLNNKNVRFYGVSVTVH